jgi:hypothetical protein
VFLDARRLTVVGPSALPGIWKNPTKKAPATAGAFDHQQNGELNQPCLRAEEN